MINDTLIKSIQTKRYTVSLYKTPSEQLFVAYTNHTTEHTQLSEMIKDFNFASYLFNLKVDELDGN